MAMHLSYYVLIKNIFLARLMCHLDDKSESIFALKPNTPLHKVECNWKILTTMEKTNK